MVGPDGVGSAGALVGDVSDATCSSSASPPHAASEAERDTASSRAPRAWRREVMAVRRYGSRLGSANRVDADLAVVAGWECVTPHPHAHLVQEDRCPRRPTTPVPASQ